MTAALPMGGNKITGLADPTVATDATTKNYVDTTTASFFSTGDVKLTFKTTADAGWTMFADQTIGSAASGANETGPQLQALFNLLFNNINDPNAPLLTSGGGATTRAGQTNAATAWAANCRMFLPKTLGRALGISGAGSGLTARTLGQILGAETFALQQNQLPNIALAYSSAVTVTSTVSNIGQGTIASAVNGSSGTTINPFSNGAASSAVTSTGTVSGFTGSMNGGVVQQNISIMPPISFFNAMIKQ